MVLQAFIDDSATPGGIFVIAGHIATAEVWSNFSKDWEQMLRHGTLNKDNKYHFKMSEMASNSERMERVEAFYRIIEHYDLLSISCMVDVRSIKQATKRIWCLRANLNFGPYTDPFIFVFKALIDSLHANRHEHHGVPDGRIDFIFDNQAQKKLILSVWDEFVEAQKPEIRELFGATPRFEDDNEFLPLQAADLWAWWVREWHEHGNPIVVKDGQNNMVLPLVSSDRPKRGIIIEYGEDKIVEALIGQFNSQFPSVQVYDSGYRGHSWSLF